jgi:two-component system, LytTR family, sensor histidine kinase AlgZ
MSSLMAPRRRIGFWPLQLAGWGAWVVIYATASLGMLPADEAFAQKVLSGTAGLMASLPLRTLYRRLRRGRLPVVAHVAIVAAACYVMGVVWNVAHHAAAVAVGVRAAERASILAGTLELASTLLAWTALYYAIGYEYDAARHERALWARQIELERQRVEAAKANALARDAQLRALRYQLNPHFLFNALNSLSTLIVEGETARAQRLLASIAAFLRATLDDEGAADITLERELALVDSYLDIERARFGDALRTEVDVEEETLQARVPTLLLQPLIENAVRHGVSRHGAGLVVVRASRARGRLAIEVRDDCAVDAQATGAPGLGLANVHGRLAAAFGDDFVLDMRHDGDGHTTVALDLPYRTAPLSGVPA